MTHPLHNPADHGAGEDVDVEAALARMDAQRDRTLDNDAPPVPWVPLKDRKQPYRPRRVDGARPGWHRVLTPETVAAAWSRFVVTLAALEEASEHLRALRGDEKAEEASRRTAIVTAIEAGGTAIKSAKTTDWTQERLVRETRHRMAREAAVEARVAYDAAVVKALPGWLASIKEELPEGHRAAREAMATLSPAISAWRAMVNAAGVIERELNPNAYPARPTKAARDLLAAGVQGLGAAERMLGSNDPVVTGGYLSDDEGLDPPRWYRATMADSEQGYMALGPIEASEGYTVTRHTWQSRSLFLPRDVSDADLRRHMLDTAGLVVI
jgi:hypothetical protein